MVRGFLVDTCILSELVKSSPDPRLTGWFSRQRDEELFVSVVTVAEITQGVERMDPGPRRDHLAEWLEEMLRTRRRMILPADLDVARVFGVLQARAARAGHLLPVQDAWIAATALAHGLTVVTRNTRDFEGSGVPLLDPAAG